MEEYNNNVQDQVEPVQVDEEVKNEAPVVDKKSGHKLNSTLIGIVALIMIGVLVGVYVALKTQEVENETFNAPVIVPTVPALGSVDTGINKGDEVEVLEQEVQTIDAETAALDQETAALDKELQALDDDLKSL